MPTVMKVGNSTHDDAFEAGRDAAASIFSDLDGLPAALSLIFVSTDYDLKAVLAGVREVSGATPTLGCSTASQFTPEGAVSNSVSVAIIASDEMKVQVAAAQEWNRDPEAAVGSVLEAFKSSDDRGDPLWRGRTLLLMADGLKGGIETLVEQFTIQTSMRYQIFGAVAADAIQFKQTFVIHNDEVSSNAFACAEVLSATPFGIGFGHGWRPAGKPLRATRVDGSSLIELNGRPAWQAYEAFAAAEGDEIAPGSEQSYLIGHVLGLETDGKYKLRVPLGKNEDGSLNMAVEIGEGELVHIMRSTDDDILMSGHRSVNKGMATLDTEEYAGALVIECAATQLFLGDRFSSQVRNTAGAISPWPIFGGASYGQVIRTSGSVAGVSCASSVACLIPR